MFCILILTSASTPFILGKSRMRKRARTDLCGGRTSNGRPYRDSYPETLDPYRDCPEAEVRG